MDIRLQGVSKRYRSTDLDHPALDGIDLTIATGEMTAIMGPSGSGKSTLLNLITGIDSPSEGTVTVGETDLSSLSRNQLAQWRGNHIGIIFQFFQLLPTLTALENVMLPMAFMNRGKRKDRARWARENLELVGLGDRMDRVPGHLSGGEQQRVAIARSLANDPEIIVGDEPTGNLDSGTESEMFEIFRDLNNAGKTVLFVTHSEALADRADRIVRIVDGQLAEAG